MTRFCGVLVCCGLLAATQPACEDDPVTGSDAAIEPDEGAASDSDAADAELDGDDGDAGEAGTNALVAPAEERAQGGRAADDSHGPIRQQRDRR